MNNPFTFNFRYKVFTYFNLYLLALMITDQTSFGQITNTSTNAININEATNMLKVKSLTNTMNKFNRAGYALVQKSDKGDNIWVHVYGNSNINTDNGGRVAVMALNSQVQMITWRQPYESISNVLDELRTLTLTGYFNYVEVSRLATKWVWRETLSNTFVIIEIEGITSQSPFLVLSVKRSS